LTLHAFLCVHLVIHQKISDPFQLDFGVVVFDPRSEFTQCRELKNYESFHGLSLFHWFPDQTFLHLDVNLVRCRSTPKDSLTGRNLVFLILMDEEIKVILGWIR
jgi:hypothetical protein